MIKRKRWSQDEITRLSIPFLKRKWDKIDISHISKYEESYRYRLKILQLYKLKKLSLKEISSELNISYGQVWYITSKYGDTHGLL